MPFSKNKNNNNNSPMPVLKLCFTPSGEIRRLAALDEPPKYETLEQHARRFFSIADGPITMTYHDDEEELVTLSTDEELADAFAQARAARGSLKLFVSPRFAEAAPPRAVHTGVTCDRSGMSPIVGPRFHLPGRDYDLCEAEFLKLDAAARKAFVRIDRPQATVPKEEVCLWLDDYDDGCNTETKYAVCYGQCEGEVTYNVICGYCCIRCCCQGFMGRSSSD